VIEQRRRLNGSQRHDVKPIGHWQIIKFGDDVPAFCCNPLPIGSHTESESGTVSVMPMGMTRLAYPPLVLGLLGLHACGGQASPGKQTSTESGTGGAVASQTGVGGQVLSGTGGAAGVGGLVLSSAGGAAVAGGAGTAGTSAVCPVEQKVGAPSLSTDCTIAARLVDRAFTCESTDCAITKALDLTCTSLPEAPWLSATADGAALLLTTSATSAAESGKAVPRLMTVEASGSRLQTVQALQSPLYSTQRFALSTSPTGANWLFTGDTRGIIAVHGTDAGWTSAPVVPALKSNNEAILTDVSVVDDRLGYLTYYSADDWKPHLVASDGSCWTDQVIGEPQVVGMVIETDAKKQPWVAWISAESSDERPLYLRSPSGDTQNLLANVTAMAPLSNAPLRLLPGGLDGTSTSPTVAARFTDGIRLFSKSPTADSAWLGKLLGESAGYGATGDCLTSQPSYESGNHCLGATSCTEQVSGVGAGFDLVRAQSGATFAAWVRYSSEGSYALKEICKGYELPQCYCGRTETSGTGTADLTVARLTESEPIFTHFRFVMSGAVSNLSSGVAMAARGDTLIVVAYLSGETVPTLTYLEIDSKRLP
jgi:hypothetical protein